MLKKILQFFRNNDELIGVWTREDDGSGLLNVFGWSLHFLDNGIGKSYYWDNGTEWCYDFEWFREDTNRIKLRTKNNDWEIIVYDTKKCVGVHKLKQIKLIEVGKENFWNSPEPLFKNI